jgi:hypothetical protein
LRGKPNGSLGRQAGACKIFVYCNASKMPHKWPSLDELYMNSTKVYKWRKLKVK